MHAHTFFLFSCLFKPLTVCCNHVTSDHGDDWLPAADLPRHRAEQRLDGRRHQAGGAQQGTPGRSNHYSLRMRTSWSRD